VVLQHVLDASVESFGYAIGFGATRRAETMLNVQFGAEFIELVPARRGSLV